MHTQTRTHTHTHTHTLPFLGAVCGHTSRIPYSHLERIQCSVIGLPEGIQFKQPSLYKAHELKQVYKCLEKVKFIPLPASEEIDSTTIIVDPCTSEEVFDTIVNPVQGSD